MWFFSVMLWDIVKHRGKNLDPDVGSMNWELITNNLFGDNQISNN